MGNHGDNDIPHIYEDKDFLRSPDARSLRILSEYIYPHTVLTKQKITDTIVFFGSARTFPPEHAIKENDLSQAPSRENESSYWQLEKYSAFYEKARELSYVITKWARKHYKNTEGKLCIATGGGPGIMEAANRGAKDADGKSIGLNITLPFEKNSNQYISKELNFKFHYFFMRKYWFLYYARALVVFPGGFGTLDELFETLTLQQTKKTKNYIPVLLYGKSFWKKLINFDFLCESGMVSPKDLQLIHFVDSTQEAFEKVKACFPQKEDHKK